MINSVVTNITDALRRIKKAKKPLEVRTHKTIGGAECYRIVDTGGACCFKYFKTGWRILIKAECNNRIASITNIQIKASQFIR